MAAYRRGFMSHITCRLTANLPRTGISSGTLRSVIEYGLPFFILHVVCLYICDTITQWREDWSSVSVVNHTIVTDSVLSDSQVSISFVIHGL